VQNGAVTGLFVDIGYWSAATACGKLNTREVMHGKLGLNKVFERRIFPKPTVLTLRR